MVIRNTPTGVVRQQLVVYGRLIVTVCDASKRNAICFGCGVVIAVTTTSGISWCMSSYFGSRDRWAGSPDLTRLATYVGISRKTSM